MFLVNMEGLMSLSITLGYLNVSFSSPFLSLLLLIPPSFPESPPPTSPPPHVPLRFIPHLSRCANIPGVMGFTRSMDHLHPTLNIRCIGLAPGAFHTALWSEEKKSWMDNTEWLPLAEVVDGMMRCIEDEGIKGGEILEILTGKQRVLPLGGGVAF